uniref:Amino acid transporter transmembrane domain-containing protein n=1 Tax=Ditylenchus dipsaci TaxID=166011 RepID=A0A915DUI9_9BILA
MHNINQISGNDLFPAKNIQLQPNGHFEKAKGLNWFITGLFIVGDLAGGGMVALPMAMVQTGIVLGLILNVAMAMIKAYTAYLLGQCWVILQQNWPEEYATEHCRRPYPEIGSRALGPRMKTFVSICIDFTQFGVCFSG